MKDFFPVQCASTLQLIGTMVRDARHRQSIRQADLAERAEVSLRTVRRIEAGESDGVSLRDFMLVLFTLGLSERVFRDLRDDPAFTAGVLDASVEKRVRLTKTRAEDF